MTYSCSTRCSPWATRDSSSGEERYREIRAAGHSTLVVSHDPLLIGEFCDRAVLLSGGRIVAEGPAPDVAETYLSRLVKAS